MPWHFTHDVEAFRAAAGPYLSADPGRNTVLLTVSEMVRRHGPFVYGKGAPVLFGWWRAAPDGPVGAACLQTPPMPLQLSVMTDDAARALARELQADALPDARGSRGATGVTGARGATGVTGESPNARAFAEEWASGGFRVAHETRLFRLGELTPPRPGPDGRARLATPEEIPFAAAWLSAFRVDIGEEAADCTDAATTRVRDGRLLFWETGGRPAAMAGVSPVVAGQARVAPVYTPPELRGRGYAGAVTVAATRLAQRSGADEVLLFTDLANPTSNALYRRLGYRPVTDHLELVFT
ncbi:GNAT family N-acetyltransferase [Streptomyces sp. NPDC057445]|uniref:GNAT family N-acetyltransferase n=1 Tax=Streptomyces sp. NPDC057445 TaxID=3346136 RepID=UPI0036A82574